MFLRTAGNGMGLGYVPQQREIFPSLTVEENLAVAARAGGWSIEAVFDLFPSLKERRGNSGNKLSGGEQQMLAIGRALVGNPKVLLLDEPLEGLAPIVIEALIDALARIRSQSGVTIILVEQKAELRAPFRTDVIVLDRGRIVHRGKSLGIGQATRRFRRNCSASRRTGRGVRTGFLETRKLPAPVRCFVAAGD